MIVSSYSYAHEFTPTYPKFEPSYVEGIMQTSMRLFNKRNDVEYYELDVYDNKWQPIKFGANEKVIRVAYLQTKHIDVYVRKEDLNKVVYICTTSKHIAKKDTTPLVSSRICSKVK